MSDPAVEEERGLALEEDEGEEEESGEDEIVVSAVTRGSAAAASNDATVGTIVAAASSVASLMAVSELMNSATLAYAKWVASITSINRHLQMLPAERVACIELCSHVSARLTVAGQCVDQGLNG